MNEKALRKLKRYPVLFADLLMAFKPFSYQSRLLKDRSKRIVGCWGRQSGKTTTIAGRTIYFAYSHPNTTTLIVSPSLRQSMIMFDRILNFIYGSSILPKSVVRKTRTIIELSNGSKIVALPCSKHLLRGYTAHLIICEEAAFMPEDVITQVIFPMISTTKGTAIFLSTPWGRDHFFYRAFMNPDYSVHKVKSSQCPLITDEFLAEMRGNMTADAYKMEYEAEFVEALNSYFSQDLIRTCVELAQNLQVEYIRSLEDHIPRGEYYGGVDLGKKEDFSILMVLKREDEIFKLVYFYQFPLGTSYSQVIGHVVRANEKFKFRKVLVDQTGVGEPVLDEFRQQGLTNIEGLTFTTRTKEELLSCLKIAMEQGRLALPYNRNLCTQINEQRFEYSKSGHLQFSHPVGSHDDMLWALALGVYVGTVGREPEPQLIYIPRG